MRGSVRAVVVNELAPPDVLRPAEAHRLLESRAVTGKTLLKVT